ncbi:MAG: extracellular solute-binding protein, partial [Paracoccaceae bacterium]|nr:extracellular solute-binding protein [Paracoccaceae bacterium]
SNAEITISSTWGSDKPFQKVVDAFNAKGLGVTAVNRFDGNYEEATAKAVTSVAVGRAPDLMVTGWKFGYFARRTLGARDFSEIDANRAAAIIANFKPQVRPLVTIDGALIGLPWAMSTPVTWINRDLWVEAGLDGDIPMDITHDWLLDRCAELDGALKAKGHGSYRTPLDLSNNEWTSQSYIQNAGGFILDPEGRLALDSAEAAAGMTAFAEPVRRGLWRPVDGATQLNAFTSQALAVTTTSSAYASLMNKQGFDVVARQFPRLGGARQMNSGGNFLAIYTKNDERAQAALTFLEFAASAEGQKVWSEVGYLNTSVHDIAPMRNQEAASAQLAEGLTAETIWPGARGLEAQTVWRQWVGRILEGQASVPDALARARAEIAPLIV